MRADNQGEGGILALTALLPTRDGARTRGVALGLPLLMLGIFGAALLYGDGMITPAISVLGAVEGLAVVTPLFEPCRARSSVVILIGLFADPAARHAPGRRLFGPIMVVWFVTIAVLGVMWIVRAPEVLQAFDPRDAILLP